MGFVLAICIILVGFYFYKQTNSSIYKNLLQESSTTEDPKLIECPPGSKDFLENKKIEIKEPPKCYLNNMPIIMNGDPVVSIEIVYGSYYPLHDVNLPLSEKVFILPSGKLKSDEELSILPLKFSYYAGAEVGKLTGKPFPDDSKLWFTKRGEQYVSLEGYIEGPNANNEYCGKYIAKGPASGNILVCGTSNKNHPTVSSQSLNLLDK